uniref:Fungal lipase-type domain-containing protein n=1 Tax=Chromera velia CCMP2878 TaxID=1169474 RepID=A0A0G4I2C7_9ALVE|eukprot:Cvel_10370.t1-p1 / transcript=Cvel_10370.t1 / gene=Cvel_10370 / organism=Chromera_velia_CCMP2878 / gene_product=hypothetical protein / transcript_product=hypothetical protein / location=Cvel_scaffold624:53596-55246(-) / protein_length=500 / sequence_SO=supercontig / SO=protein_coding / is_pseudo=false
MVGFSLTTLVVLSSACEAAPLLRRLLSDRAPEMSVTKSGNLTMTPFEYPYPTDANTMGLTCNSKTTLQSVNNTLLEGETAEGGELGSFLKCINNLIFKAENLPEAMCSCMGMATSEFDVCPELLDLVEGFLCSQDKPYCKDKEPDAVPLPVPIAPDSPELNLPFETPKLPLPSELKDFVSSEETSTGSLLWLAQFAQNWKYAEEGEKKKNSYNDLEILPGWKPERIFVPNYKQSTAEISDDGLPWVSVSSRNNSLLVIVRGIQTFAEWVSDFDYPQVPAPFGMPGQVARGFSTVAVNVVEDLKSIITPTTDKVIVTGHSLGGFAGTIVAAGLHQHVETSVDLSAEVFGVLFTSGRVGDVKWQQEVNSKVNLRFVQFLLDPVPYSICQSMPDCGLPGSFNFDSPQLRSLLGDSFEVSDQAEMKTADAGEMDSIQKSDQDYVYLEAVFVESSDATLKSESSQRQLASKHGEIPPELGSKRVEELIQFGDRTGVMTFSNKNMP